MTRCDVGHCQETATHTLVRVREGTISLRPACKGCAAVFNDKSLRCAEEAYPLVLCEREITLHRRIGTATSWDHSGKLTVLHTEEGEVRL